MAIERVSGASSPVYPMPQVGGGHNENGDVNKIDKPAKNLTEMQEKRDEIQKENERKKLEEVIKGMNGFLEPSQTSLRFQLHEELNEYYVSVVNDQTKEVVREIPPRKLLDMYAAMKKFLGLIVDKKI